MNTPQNAGAVSLKDSIIEVEGWTAALYQQNFMDFLEQQPYIMGTLMEADEGMDDGHAQLDVEICIAFKMVVPENGMALDHA